LLNGLQRLFPNYKTTWQLTLSWMHFWWWWCYDQLGGGAAGGGAAVVNDVY
jgi:hypothetical protein